MKSYADLEQSKKLAEFLPLESADMYYWHGSHRLLRVNDGKCEDIDIPAWSLTALLGVLPKNLDIGRPVLATNYRGYYWVSYFDEYMKEKFTSNIYDNPVDACYELILKLYELNLL